jgi:type IV secretion system protein VirB2
MTVAYPSSPSAIAAALQWLQGTLFGSAATAVAVIAVAWIGFLMLSGRVDLGRAGRVVMGCFILFGASAIAQGIVAQVQGSAAPGLAEASPPPSPPPSYAAAPSAYDPYAGAALAPR